MLYKISSYTPFEFTHPDFPGGAYFAIGRFEKLSSKMPKGTMDSLRACFQESCFQAVAVFGGRYGHRQTRTLSHGGYRAYQASCLFVAFFVDGALRILVMSWGAMTGGSGVSIGGGDGFLGWFDVFKCQQFVESSVRETVHRFGESFVFFF